MSTEGIPGGGRITGSMTPVPMRHRERRDTDVYPRNLPSGEWLAVDSDVAPLVWDVDGQRDESAVPVDFSSVDPAKVRAALARLDDDGAHSYSVAPRVLEALSDERVNILGMMMAQAPAETSRMVKTERLLEEGLLDGVLDDVGVLLHGGCDVWPKLVSDGGLLRKAWKNCLQSASALHCAARYLARARDVERQFRLGPQFEIRFADLPRASSLQQRFQRELNGKDIGNLLEAVPATAVLVGDVVVHSVFNGQHDVAFHAHGTGDPYGVRQTMLGYKLMALARHEGIRARGVDVVLCGRNRINRSWLNEMQDAASSNSLGLNFRVRSILTRNAPMTTILR